MERKTIKKKREEKSDKKRGRGKKTERGGVERVRENE